MPRPLAPGVLESTSGDPDAVRDHILDAAHRVVAREGLAAASTRSIAEEAGIGVGTLYNYFDDRVELLVGSLLRRAHALSRPLGEVASLAGTGTVAANLQRFARELCAMLDQLVPLFAAAFSDAELLEGVRRTARSHLPGSFAVHPIERYLLAERELGRVTSSSDCHAAAGLILALCHERAFLRYFHGANAKARSTTREIEFIAAAIAPPLPRGERGAARSIRVERRER